MTGPQAPGVSAQELRWDTNHFGVRIAAVQEPLSPERIVDAARWQDEAHVDCLYLLVPADASDLTALAQAEGFRFVDVRETLGRDAPAATALPPGVRPARAEDLPALETIAADGHHDSRFFVDPAFDDDAAAEVYRLWLRNSFSGELDEIFLVADDGAGACGYITGSLVSGGAVGRIGLVGVGSDQRGRGVALRLLDAFAHVAAEAGATRLQVATQSRNIAARRLYGRAGYQLESVSVWFHRWTKRPEPLS